MCLTVKRRAKKKIAQQDIPCLKVLQTNGELIQSPFMNSVYTLGKLEESSIGKKEVAAAEGILFFNILDWIFNGSVYIEEGLHSFIAGEDIALFTRTFNDALIYSAVIPKGAEYYEGVYKFYNVNGLGMCGNLRSYVSNQLIVKDLI